MIPFLKEIFKQRFKDFYLCHDFSKKYEIGDDCSYIDPFLSAKKSEIFIKIFREYRDVDLVLVLDVSSSQLCGTQCPKLDVACKYAEKIFELAHSVGDKVKILTFSSKIKSFFTLKKGICFLPDIPYFFSEKGYTNLAVVLDCVQRVLKKTSVIFWISDFIYPDQSFENILYNARLVAKKHDLICIRIVDQIDEYEYNLGTCFFQDAESGKSVVFETNRPRYQSTLIESLHKQNRKWHSGFGSPGITFIQAKTTEDIYSTLRKILEKR